MDLKTAAGGAGGVGSEYNYLDGPGEGEGGRSGDGGHVRRQTGGVPGRRGGGGHEERESDGAVAGWVGWELGTGWPERALYTRRGGDAAAGIGRIDGRRRGPRSRKTGPCGSE